MIKLIGVARAGTENVDVKAATERGIIVVHIMGRKAQAGSDFSIGLMLCDSRNIAHTHMSIFPLFEKICYNKVNYDVRGRLWTL
ncbi:lactate dehydrogenase-like 2-hydroxyacid dehydrogenase [Paenibacillus sp. PvR052]